MAYDNGEIRKLLRSGITCNRNVSVTTFKSACFQVSLDCGAKVVAVRPASPHVSFHYAEIMKHEFRFGVLCNTAYPIVGFTLPFDDGDSYGRFLNAVELSAQFKNLAFECPDAKMFEAPSNDDAIAGLLPTERKDIEYWKPRRVGEIVFNYFD